MPRLSLIITSFGLLLGVFIYSFRDSNNSVFDRSPASVENKYSDQTFIEAVISSRKVNKIVKSFIETSNSLFFMNSDSYLCFELGKSEVGMNKLRELVNRYSHTWPIGQKQSVESFINKYPEGFSKICQNDNTKKKKTYLMQIGINAREVYGNVYLDKHYSRNYREYYEALELNIEKGHQEIIYKEISNYLGQISSSSKKDFSHMKLGKACYELGKMIQPFYTLNTSYLNSSDKNNSDVIKSYGELGRSMASVGPLCHGNKSDIAKKMNKIKESAKKVGRYIR